MAGQSICGPLIKQIHDELERNTNNSMRSYDITMAQYNALSALDGSADGQLSLKELEHLLHVAQSTVAGIVSRLEQKELVKTFGSMDDRRVKMVQITPQGVGCCQRADQDMQCAEEALLSGLTDAEREIFLILLKKVCRTL